MQGRLPSAGRRFLKTSGYSLGQAAIFGGLLGLLVFFRPGHVPQEKGGAQARTLWQRLRSPLDALERVSFDWRSREAGRKAAPLDVVVLAAVDEETLANAREDENSAVATRPWPRSLLGRMVDLAATEGAQLTLLDMTFPDLSPSGPTAGSDDAAFGSALALHPRGAVLSYGISTQPLPPLSRPFLPYLVLVGTPHDVPGREALVAEVLALRRPAYAIPAPGGTGVWAGVPRAEEARTWVRGLKHPPAGGLVVREISAADRAFQVTAAELTVALSEVKVQGLNPDALVQVRRVIPPASPLLGAGRVLGFRDLARDPDRAVRGVLHLVSYLAPDGAPHQLPSSTLRAAMQLLSAPVLRYGQGLLTLSTPTGQVRARIPMDENGFSLLAWDAEEAGPAGRGSLPRSVSAWRLVRNLTDLEQGAPAQYRNELQDKAVILTDTSDGPSSWVETPVGHEVAPGAVQGQALGNLLRSEGVYRVDPRLDLIATFLLAFVGAFLALSFSGLFRSTLGALVYLATLGAAGVAYVLLARYQFVQHHRWMAVAAPLIALACTFVSTTVYKLRTESEMMEFLENALGRYVSPDITRQVFRNVGLMHPERRLVTLCVCDLDGFHRLLGALKPAQLAALLNEYLTAMTAVVRQHGGQVEYVGDALLAFFGAPIRTEKHAQLACETALQMRETLLEKQGDWEKRFGQKVEARVGLYTGEVLVGDLGSELKSNYTVMGESVAMANRLEVANRSYGTFMLAGGTTQERAGKDYLFREVDAVQMRSQVLQLFELVGRRKDVAQEAAARIARFEGALKDFRGRAFEVALTSFEAMAPVDPVSRLYVDRCRAYLASPPPPDWRGIGDLRRRGD